MTASIDVPGIGIQSDSEFWSSIPGGPPDVGDDAHEEAIRQAEIARCRADARRWYAQREATLADVRLCLARVAHARHRGDARDEGFWLGHAWQCRVDADDCDRRARVSLAVGTALRERCSWKERALLVRIEEAR